MIVAGRDLEQVILPTRIADVGEAVRRHLAELLVVGVELGGEGVAHARVVRLGDDAGEVEAVARRARHHQQLGERGPGDGLREGVEQRQPQSGLGGRGGEGVGHRVRRRVGPAARSVVEVVELADGGDPGLRHLAVHRPRQPVVRVRVEAVGDAAARTNTVLHELSPQIASLEEAYLAATAQAQEYRSGPPSLAHLPPPPAGPPMPGGGA